MELYFKDYPCSSAVLNALLRSDVVNRLLHIPLSSYSVGLLLLHRTWYSVAINHQPLIPNP